MAGTIAFTVNGEACAVAGDPDDALLGTLRDTLGLKSTRLGCGLGQCGACTVLLDDRAVTACDTPLSAVEGKQVTTLEGLGSRDAPHPLQTAFIDEQALQCGWCTSGMLMRAAELLRREPHPDEAAVRQALERNLCRCGVHNRIVRAVLKASA
ncbi:(2Fe-2S)-binding protein [Ramlibacter rhizophilus]|uniref:(2Fe-2S)-binding protein n=1 Tax=Ramlibacter rhizophilus TaxID=1781167 RepID=A0A4Z0BNB3_9BURK|nr:(2Fe-2S)-binding protein [Ramlibacter rhizophilus]TFY99544.1 (2Fe-2S)-binding protein [Ramlibacter rhizophilus]